MYQFQLMFDMLNNLLPMSLFCKTMCNTFMIMQYAPHLVIHVSSYETFQMGVQPRQNEATSFCCLLSRHQQ